MGPNCPSFVLFGGTPDALSSASARRAVLTLPWAQAPLPGDPWLAQLLPRAAHNTALMDRLAATPPPPGAWVALFLADPLLDLDRTLARLSGWGVAGVAAFPGLTRFRGGFADALAQAGLSVTQEAEGLGRARAAGFATLAALWHGAAWPAEATPPDHVLGPPGARISVGGTRWLYAPRNVRRPRDAMLWPAAHSP